jgi:hypothetical protein
MQEALKLSALEKALNLLTTVGGALRLRKKLLKGFAQTFRLFVQLLWQLRAVGSEDLIACVCTSLNRSAGGSGLSN